MKLCKVFFDHLKVRFKLWLDPPVVTETFPFKYFEAIFHWRLSLFEVFGLVT